MGPETRDRERRRTAKSDGIEIEERCRDTSPKQAAVEGIGLPQNPRIGS